MTRATNPVTPAHDEAASRQATAPADLPIHGMPGHYIRRLQQVAVALFARRVNGIVTPVQYAALVALAHQGPCDQARLAALVGCDRATVGDVLDRLEARGWLARAPGTRDRRIKLVSLTPAGRAAVRRASDDVERAQHDIVAPLRAAERRQFERLCRKLLLAHERTLAGDAASPEDARGA